MPSKAFSNFENNSLTDVDELIALHAANKTGKRGKQGLGHLTRSGIVMLCAGWEVYVEDVVKESVGYLVEGNNTASNLKKCVQKAIVSYLENDKHELASLRLAGTGWRDCLRELANERCKVLNTPKSLQINELCAELLGLEEISKVWRASDKVDAFVDRRGAIAHSGSNATYPAIGELTGLKAMVCDVVKSTDNRLSIYLKTAVSPQKAPWKRRA